VDKLEKGTEKQRDASEPEENLSQQRERSGTATEDYQPISQYSSFRGTQPNVDSSKSRQVCSFERFAFLSDNHHIASIRAPHDRGPGVEYSGYRGIVVRQNEKRMMNT
jgi:hypothetical protein